LADTQTFREKNMWKSYLAYQKYMTRKYFIIL